MVAVDKTFAAGRKGEWFFRCGRQTCFKKSQNFSKVIVCPHEQGEGGVEAVWTRGG